MLIDCDTCAVRGAACGGCVIRVLLDAPPMELELDDVELAAFDVLAAADMVPRLRYVAGRPHAAGEVRRADTPRRDRRAG